MQEMAVQDHLLELNACLNVFSKVADGVTLGAIPKNNQSATLNGELNVASAKM